MAKTDGQCPNLLKALESLNNEVGSNLEYGMFESLFKNSIQKVIQSEEMVEIPPKDIVDANMIKRGFLKPRMRPKSISIEYKPRIKE